MEPVSASAVKSPRAKAEASTPRAMRVEEIQTVVEAFAQAACRAQEAGFDGVELHAAHGYLLNQFYSPLTNHRTDAYTGATLAGRLRFLLEAVEAVRAAVGQELLLAVRLGAGDDMPGGTTVEDSVRACQLLEQAGVDLLDISGGFCGPYRGGSKEQGYFSDWSQTVKAAVSVPVLVTGGTTVKYCQTVLSRPSRANSSRRMASLSRTASRRSRVMAPRQRTPRPGPGNGWR